jgi:hypothetical protein
LARRRRRRYEINPITGFKEPIPRKNEYRNYFTGAIEKKPRYPINEIRLPKLSRKQGKEVGIALSLFIGFALLFLMLNEFHKYYQEHKVQVILALALIVVAIIIGVIVYFKKILPTKRKSEDEELNLVINALKSYTSERILRDEREFETAIYEYLKTRFSDKKIISQKETKFGKRVDIVINDRIGIELKIADNSGNLDSLFAQIEWYKENFEKLLFVILDMNKVHHINEYVKRFRDKGIEVILIKDIRFRRTNRG